MSRLDDELRKAYRREQPPVDFTARLLERVALQPLPKMRWWQRFATLLDPPKLRWVAIGVAASLLLAIGAAQYRRLNQVVVTEDKTIATTERAPESSGKETVKPGTGQPRQETIPATPRLSLNNRKSAPYSPGSRLAQARHQDNRESRAEGEAAKEQLMLALSIASSALSDAQKAVHDDGLNP